jgi:ferrochelatase
MTNLKYDAILFLSFGGPEGMDDVMPFLANVLRGKNVPEARMKEVAHHYEQFNGVSPINGQNRALIQALKEELTKRSIDLPVYWGNRNWHPLLADTLKEMKADGVERALAFVTSAYSSYSGCRQYLEDIERARLEVPDAPQIDKLRVFYNHPLFIEANCQNLLAGFEQLVGKTADLQSAVHVAFTAHSIPKAMADTCSYHEQLLEACRLVTESEPLAGKFRSHDLVFQSRSGPASQPWLEPDILEHIKSLHEQGVINIIVHPIGFVSDHMEVQYDLDTEAQSLAQSLGMNMVRSKTAGTNPLFIRMMADLIVERLQSEEGVERKAIGKNSAGPDFCQPSCCAYVPARPGQRSAS